LSYEEFGHAAIRWSSRLPRLGVRQGDRVAYIAPNTHAQLESFYAVPQIGAVLVPMNFRWSPTTSVPDSAQRREGDVRRSRSHCGG
jgi:fatty-acyl-CoA synthase